MTTRGERERREKEAAQLRRAGAGITWAEYWWQVYVGVGLVLSLCFGVVAVAVVLDVRFSGATYLQRVRATSVAMAVIGLALSFAVVPAIRIRGRGWKLLVLVALPLTLAGGLGHAALLGALVFRPAAAEKLLGERALGQFPEVGGYAAPSASLQFDWWLDFVERHAGAPEAEEVAGRLTSGLWAVPSPDRAAAVRRAVAVLRGDPARQRALGAGLGRLSARDDEVGATVREAIGPAEAPVR